MFRSNESFIKSWSPLTAFKVEINILELNHMKFNIEGREVGLKKLVRFAETLCWSDAGTH